MHYIPLVRRRMTPQPAARPVARRTKLEGSGTADACAEKVSDVIPSNSTVPPPTIPKPSPLEFKVGRRLARFR